MPESITYVPVAVTPGSGVELNGVQVNNGTSNVINEVVCIGDPATGSQIAEVTPKGTQADNFLGIQEAKDSGRSVLVLTTNSLASSTTTTVTSITTLVQNSNWTSSTGVTTFQVPVGKTLRIQEFSGTAIAASTTSSIANGLQCVFVEIRVSTTNTAMASAPIAAMLEIPVTVVAATSTASTSPQQFVAMTQMQDFPDGIEVPATYYVGITYHNNQTTIATQLLGVSMVGYTY
jgi:hypothetical protein